MADKTIETDQNVQTDIETLLRQSVLLPSQKKAFDRYMTESTNEEQKREFQDILKEIEREVLQTYEEYRYTGKPVAEFLKWKDKEIAPLAKVLTGRVNALYAREFGEEEQEISEAERDLPEASDDTGADQEETEQKEKEEAEERDEEIEEAQQQTVNGYTQEENEKWQQSLERRAQKQKEWDQFLQNRRDAEKQAERDEELFRDHPEYFSDPYQEEADEAEREARLEAEREAAESESANRQYFDKESRAEQERYLHGSTSHKQIPDDHSAESGIEGVVVNHKDNRDASYAGEMLQRMLDGKLERPTSQQSKTSKAVGKSASSDKSGSGYDDGINARIENRMAQRRYLHGSPSHKQNRDAHSAESGIDGVTVNHKDNRNASYAGEMLQGMLDGKLERPTWQQSKTSEAVGKSASPDKNGSDDESINAGIANRMEQRLAAEKARRSGLLGHAGSLARSNANSGHQSTTQKSRSSIRGSEVIAQGASAIVGEDTEESKASAVTARKKIEKEMVTPGVAAFSGNKLNNTRAYQSEEPHASDAIRSLKHDKAGIRTQKITDREAAKQYAERIAAAYASGASVFQARQRKSFTDHVGGNQISGVKSGSGKNLVGDSLTAVVKNGSGKKTPVVNLKSGQTVTGHLQGNGTGGGSNADGSDIIGVGGSILPADNRSVIQVGKALGKGVAAGSKNIGKAAQDGVGGGSGSSAAEDKEIREMGETARAMRERIVNTAAARTRAKLRYRSASYGGFGAASAFTERKQSSNARAGLSVENASSQVRDGSSGRSVIRMTSDGFVKKNRSAILKKAGGSVAGGVTDSASIVGAGGVLTTGAGTVAQIGKMAARGAAAGANKIGKAAQDGVSGGSGSSSTEDKEIKKMKSAARVMREKIIGSTGRAVGSSPGMKTAVNKSFRVVQKFSKAVKTGEDEEEDDKEGTSEDPKAVERIWRRNVRINNAAKKKFPWKTLFGGAVSGGITHHVIKAVGGALGLAHPFLIFFLVILINLVGGIGASAFLHQVDASFPASGRYSMTGEEVGDYLDDNASYASSDDGSGSIASDDTTGTWTGAKLTKESGRIVGPSGGEETYYNQNMDGVVTIMRSIGNNDKYWVRDDGVKMLGDYVMVAANLSLHPRGSKVETSLGTGIVCDTGTFAAAHPKNIDIATDW